MPGPSALRGSAHTVVGLGGPSVSSGLERASRPPPVRRRGSCGARMRVIVVTPRTSSSAAAIAGSARSPSRSIQNTYSQARSRLGRDSSLRMFRPWAAMTRRTASSVPGSLRTATTSVVRRRRRVDRASAARPAGPGRGSASGCPAGRRSRRRAPRGRTGRGARRQHGRRRPLTRSAMALPAPAVL